MRIQLVLILKIQHKHQDKTKFAVSRKEKLIFKRREAGNRPICPDQITDAQTTAEPSKKGSVRRRPSLPLKVFQVEPFCAAAEPSESSTRSRAEPRTEQARLLLPIAATTGGGGGVGSSSRSSSSKNARPLERRGGAEGKRRRTSKGGRAMRVRRPRWIFKTKRETKNWRWGGDAMMLLSCVPCVMIGEEEEKVASGSGEPGLGLGGGKVVAGQRIVCELLLLSSLDFPSRSQFPTFP